jgi:hypothetical protein
MGIRSNVDAAVDNLTKTFTATTDYFQARRRHAHQE